MQQVPKAIKNLRTIYLRLSREDDLENLVKRMEDNLSNRWTRVKKEEESLLRFDGLKTYIFQRDTSDGKGEAVVYVNHLKERGGEIIALPPFDRYGAFPQETLSKVLNEFLAEFRPFMEELNITFNLTPELVNIRAFVGDDAAKVFNTVVQEYKQYRSSLASPHMSSKWTAFVCQAYESNSGGHLTASKLAALLQKEGFPEDYAAELGRRWETACETLSAYLTMRKEADSQ